MNDYSRSAFVLGKTFHEFFKLNSKDVLSSMNDIIEKGNVLKIENDKECCTFNINNIDYVAVKYNMGNDLRLMVSKANLIKEKTLKHIRSVCFMDVELDFSHQILYYMNDVKSGKVNADINELQNLHDEYILDKKRFSDYGYDTQYINSHIEYNTSLIEQVLKSLNIESKNIISVMKKEITLKTDLMKNDLVEIFNKIPKSFNLGEKYYYGDADFSLVLISDDNDNILLGYNNVVSFDEYFMLLRKCGDNYSITLESFKNLENINGFKKLKTLNAFENITNTEIVKKLRPVYESSDKNKFKINDFTTLAFSINNINYSLTNEEPC
jgi:hypothetical protein